MGNNFTATLHINIHLKPGVKKHPDDWLVNTVDDIFAKEEFDEYCDIESALKSVDCEQFKYNDGNLVDSVSLEYADFHIGGCYESDYDKLVSEIINAIREELEKSGATGNVLIAGYDTDRQPDISASVQVGTIQKP